MLLNSVSVPSYIHSKNKSKNKQAKNTTEKPLIFNPKEYSFLYILLALILIILTIFIFILNILLIVFFGRRAYLMTGTQRFFNVLFGLLLLTILILIVCRFMLIYKKHSFLLAITNIGIHHLFELLKFLIKFFLQSYFIYI